MSINIYSHKRYRYLLLIPICFLVFNALFFHYATGEIHNALIREKFEEVKECLDVLEATLATRAVEEIATYEVSICNAIEYIDRLYQVYAGAYALKNNELVPITDRFYETSIFEPLDYPEFVRLISEQEHGEIIIGYTPKQQTYRELCLYFKWLTNHPEDGRYLTVAGVSEYSVTVGVALWVSVSQWISTAITFILQVWLIALVARLSHEHESYDAEFLMG
ncbi:MAG: hypothetical protein FWF06_03620 [Symbiobacteriaceae bacterium]|nr:hypothetical protein [Symbiobacteriaceae bacterium]